MQEEVFAKRLAIAEATCTDSLAADVDLTADLRGIYEQFPMSGFYVRASDDAPARSFGVAQDRAGTYRLHMVVATANGEKITRNGVPVTDVRRVERFTSDHLTRIRRVAARPGWFADPLGFLAAMTLGREKVEEDAVSM